MQWGPRNDEVELQTRVWWTIWVSRVTVKPESFLIWRKNRKYVFQKFKKSQKPIFLFAAACSIFGIILILCSFSIPKSKKSFKLGTPGKKCYFFFLQNYIRNAQKSHESDLTSRRDRVAVFGWKKFFFRHRFVIFKLSPRTPENFSTVRNLIMGTLF